VPLKTVILIQECVELPGTVTLFSNLRGCWLSSLLTTRD